MSTASTLSASTSRASTAATSLSTERIGDGQANCVEQAYTQAGPNDSVVVCRDRTDSTGHAVVRRADGSIVDPAQPGRTWPSLQAWNADSPQYQMVGQASKRELTQVFSAQPGPARDAVINRLGLDAIAGVMMADAPGAAAYAELVTRTEAAQSAQSAVNELEQQLSEELGIIGPTLTAAEREAYIEDFRRQHAGVYEARDAAVSSLADHVAAEGANIEAYLENYHTQSQYTTHTVAAPVFQALSLIANSDRPEVAVNMLNNHGALLTSGLAGPLNVPGLSSYTDIYAQAVGSTITNALANGASPTEAVAQAESLIRTMPNGMDRVLLGPNPSATLDALRQVASGEFENMQAGLTALGRLTGQGASPAILSAGLSMAIVMDPEAVTPELLSEVNTAVGNAGLAATAIEGTLRTLNRIVTNPALRDRVLGNPNIMAGLNLGAKLNLIVGAAGVALSLLTSLSQQNPNLGTHVQTGAALASGLLFVAQATGAVGFWPGTAMAMGLLLISEIGKAIESHIHEQEHRAEVLGRITDTLERIGVSDAAERAEIAYDHPESARTLAMIGIEWPRMGEALRAGFGSYATQFQNLVNQGGLTPQEADQLLTLFIRSPSMQGQSVVDQTSLNVVFNALAGAQRELGPDATLRDMLEWLRTESARFTYGGAGASMLSSTVNYLLTVVE